MARPKLSRPATASSSSSRRPTGAAPPDGGSSGLKAPRTAFYSVHVPVRALDAVDQPLRVGAALLLSRPEGAADLSLHLAVDAADRLADIAQPGFVAERALDRFVGRLEG